MDKSISVLLRFVREIFVSPTRASLDLDSLDKDYVSLGRALAYLGESVSENTHTASSVLQGNLLYEQAVKNDITSPIDDIKGKLVELMNALYSVADGGFDAKFSDMGDLSDAFSDMVENFRGKEKHKELSVTSPTNNIDSAELELNKSKMIEEGLFQQIAHYERLMELSGEMRGFRHDIRNHLLCLDSLLADNQIEKARDYILSITPIVYTSDLVLNTNNYIFDALLSEKIKAAKSKDIKVDVKIGVSRKLKVDNVDWCILIGNAMDNAIEAAEKVTEGERRISIVITHKGNSLSTRIENNTNETPVQDGDFFVSTKGDKYNHGLGLKSIANTVESYNGVFEASCEDGIFSLFFMLCDI